jgi:Tn3 transposase DDE domain-containing protein
MGLGESRNLVSALVLAPAYTFLANHMELSGAHQHESHFVFDVCYHNTSDIVPMAITGDMHSTNKANFGILHWFGMKLSPRFTNSRHS